MTEFSETVQWAGRGKRKRLRIRAWVMLLFALAAILFQAYAPLYLSVLSYIELPLLLTVYLAMTGRSQVAGIFIGAGIGLAQDALSHDPLGVLGIVKTLTGYVAASLGVRLDTDNLLIRFGLGFLFFVCHEVLHWVLRRALLGEAISIGILSTFLAGVVNGALAVLLFHLLDKLRENG